MPEQSRSPSASALFLQFRKHNKPLLDPRVGRGDCYVNADCLRLGRLSIAEMNDETLTTAMSAAPRAKQTGGLTEKGLY
jgi:hypothetical protein